MSAGEPDVGWDQFFADNSNIFSSVETCEDVADTMEVTMFKCCNDDVKDFFKASMCSSYSFSYGDMAEYLPDNGYFEMYDHECYENELEGMCVENCNFDDGSFCEDSGECYSTCAPCIQGKKTRYFVAT